MFADIVIIISALGCIAANVIRKDYTQAMVWFAVALYAGGQVSEKLLRGSKYDY